MKKQFSFAQLNNQRGISAVIIAVCLVMLLGFVALAIDIGHLAVARNELQNAADAGALASARYLYNDDGLSVNPNANQIGYDAAVANMSEQVPVEVNWSGGNVGDVQRGHWSFATRTFTPNDSLNSLPIWLYSEDELDSNTDFINAVRVRTRRQNTPIASWFAGIFGYKGFKGFAEAVAYIGFAGDVWEGDLDLPIAICEDSIYDEGTGTQLDCNVGRMINSGSHVENNETGGWTSFYQGFNEDGVKVDDPCSGGTNAQEVRSLVNGNSNCSGNGEPSPPASLHVGEDMATNGGEIQTAFNSLINCFQNWLNDHDPNIPWEVTLPVVSCPGNNMTTCQKVTGVATVKILWMTGAGEDPDYMNIPTEMTAIDADGNVIEYTCPDLSTLASRQACWNDFVTKFELKNAPGSNPAEAPYQKKAIYFHPSCDYQRPEGGVGGKNFGILAKIPVLVD